MTSDQHVSTIGGRNPAGKRPLLGLHRGAGACRNVMMQCVGALLACVTVALAAHATPVTIDFQVLEVPGNPSPTIIHFNYVEEGFRLTGAAVNRFGTGSRFYAGSTALRVGSLGGQLRGDLTTVSGAPFDLVALDLAEGNNGLSNVIVTGTFVGGGTITQTLFTLSPLVTNDAAASFDTFVLAGFHNLASVSFTVVDNNAFRVAQLDNIVVDEASLVPESADVILTPTSLLRNTIGNVNGDATETAYMLNHSGLSRNFISGVTDFNTYIAGNPTHVRGDFGWAGPSGGPFAGDLDFDLGDLYSVKHVVLWNTATDSSAHVRSFTLFLSSVADFSTATDLGTFVNPELMGTSPYPGTVFDHPDAVGRYLRLRIHDHYGNLTSVEIGEVAVHVSPAPVCGNTIIETSEECDDGNTANGDGCSSICQRENQAPVALCHSVTVDATASSCLLPASINQGSFDPDQGDRITLHQSPAGPYPLGSTSVTLTVTDSQLASSSCIGTVTVRDLIPPPLSCPDPITAECTGASTLVQFTAPTPGPDNCGGAQSTGCTPQPGTGFGLGSTTVSCGATDTRTTSSCAFSVQVVDTTPPSLSCPSPQTAEATSVAGAPVSFPAPTAADACTAPQVTCDALSGATFPLGVSTVQCLATDGPNSTSCHFSVTVRDTTPPTLTCPAHVTVPSGQSVILGAPTVRDLVDPQPNVSNDAPAAYPIGTTAVLWTARDASGNQATCAQTVTIQSLSFTHVEAKLDVEREDMTWELEYKMAFTLGAGSNGIAPLTEPVVVQIGGLTFTIPPGSFRVNNRKSKFTFAGRLNGMWVEASITPVTSGRYQLKLEATGLNVTGITGLVATHVTIGNDSGAATITAQFD